MTTKVPATLPVAADAKPPITVKKPDRDSKADTSKPTKVETGKPVKADTSKPIKVETGKPVKADTSKSIVKADTSKPIKKSTSPPPPCI